MAERYILALDQGTTSSRAILFDHAGTPVAKAQQEFAQLYPHPGWVEHDPMVIIESQLRVAREALRQRSLKPEDIAAIGIANQRETTIVWDRATGQPVCNAIVWQDRRTAPLCEWLRAEGWETPIREKTGLVPDPYFSATKLHWILEHIDGARARAERGELLFGTVDTFLIWRLTGGSVHATDHSNAARTMLFNIHTLDWDGDLLRELRIPRVMLPEVRDTSGPFGETDPAVFGGAIPIAGVAGDQQAATFGQACFAPGTVKTTYGTGNFMLMTTGPDARRSESGLLTTIAWKIGGEVMYALEGSIFTTGAAVQWLRDDLRIIESAAETGPLAESIADTGGVYLVPAFTGMGAPHWDPHARGAIIGLTRGSGRAQIVRAALEAVAFSTRDVLDAMRRDSSLPITTMRVDGGMVANDFLMQFQADIAGITVERPQVTETTALGAAALAGLAVGYWESREQLAARWRLDRTFHPAMTEDDRAHRLSRWHDALARAAGWTKP
jgi:glycerol kinase